MRFLVIFILAYIAIVVSSVFYFVWIVIWWVLIVISNFSFRAGENRIRKHFADMQNRNPFKKS